MIAIMFLITSVTIGFSSDVPQAIQDLLKTQPVYIIFTAVAHHNGELLQYATVWVEPYYLIVRFKASIEGLYFSLDDILEIFIVKDGAALTIWTRAPPAAR